MSILREWSYHCGMQASPTNWTFFRRSVRRGVSLPQTVRKNWLILLFGSRGRFAKSVSENAELPDGLFPTLKPNPQKQSVLITGAAGGIGRALAVRYGNPDIILHLSDVDSGGLLATVNACKATGAEIHSHIVDITEASEVTDWIKERGHIDLAILCAGVQYTSLVGRVETATETLRTININLVGTINVALAAIDIMSKQKPDPSGARGQIAILASQGAFVSVPGASTYCASKAAVDSWAVGRSALARKQGIYITSVCPGYVRTGMTEINDISMHGLMEPETAADIIAKRLAKKPVRLVFPWRMYVAARFGGLLPAGLPARILAWNHARATKSAEAYVAKINA